MMYVVDGKSSVYMYVRRAAQEGNAVIYNLTFMVVVHLELPEALCIRVETAVFFKFLRDC